MKRNYETLFSYGTNGSTFIPANSDHADIESRFFTTTSKIGFGMAADCLLPALHHHKLYALAVGRTAVRPQRKRIVALYSEVLRKVVAKCDAAEYLARCPSRISLCQLQVLSYGLFMVGWARVRVLPVVQLGRSILYRLLGFIGAGKLHPQKVCKHGQASKQNIPDRFHLGHDRAGLLERFHHAGHSVVLVARKGATTGTCPSPIRSSSIFGCDDRPLGSHRSFVCGLVHEKHEVGRAVHDAGDVLRGLFAPVRLILYRFWPKVSPLRVLVFSTHTKNPSPSHFSPTAALPGFRGLSPCPLASVFGGAA